MINRWQKKNRTRLIYNKTQRTEELKSQNSFIPNGCCTCIHTVNFITKKWNITSKWSGLKLFAKVQQFYNFRIRRRHSFESVNNFTRIHVIVRQIFYEWNIIVITWSIFLSEVNISHFHEDFSVIVFGPFISVMRQKNMRYYRLWIEVEPWLVVLVALREYFYFVMERRVEMQYSEFYPNFFYVPFRSSSLTMWCRFVHNFWWIESVYFPTSKHRSCAKGKTWLKVNIFFFLIYKSHLTSAGRTCIDDINDQKNGHCMNLW